MTETVKYTFDQAFDGGAKTRYEIEVAQLRQQIEIARREGFEKGLETGRAEIRQGLEVQMTELFSSMAAQLAAFEQDHKAHKLMLEADMVGLTNALAERLAEGFLADNPTSAIENLCREALDTLMDEAVLTLKIPDGMDEDLPAKLQQIASASGYSGDLQIEADPGLTAPNCRLLWAKGQVSYDQEKLAEQVSTLISAYTQQLSQEGSAS